jgi:hypothetical protein
MMLDFLKPKFELTALSLGQRLTEFYFQASKTLQERIVNQIDRKGGGELLYQTIRDELENLLLFTMEFTVQTTMPKNRAEQVLKHFSIGGGPTDERVKHYYECAELVHDGKLISFRQAAQEYLIVGKAFLDNCGPTENREFNNLVRQIGCEIFANMTQATKKFLKQYKVTG